MHNLYKEGERLISNSNLQASIGGKSIKNKTLT